MPTCGLRTLVYGHRREWGGEERRETDRDRQRGSRGKTTMTACVPVWPSKKPKSRPARLSQS